MYSREFAGDATAKIATAIISNAPMMRQMRQENCNSNHEETAMTEKLDTHVCSSCGETMDEKQAKSTTGCPFCYMKKGIYLRNGVNTRIDGTVGNVHHKEMNLDMAAKATTKKVVAKKVEQPNEGKKIHAGKPAELPVKKSVTKEKTPVKAPAPVTTKHGKETPAPVEKKPVHVQKTPAVVGKPAVKKPVGRPAAKKSAKEIEAAVKKEIPAAKVTVKNGATCNHKKGEVVACHNCGKNFKCPEDGTENCITCSAALKKAVKDSPENHVVKFNKNNVPEKVAPAEAKKALDKAIKETPAAKTGTKAALPKKKEVPKCLCIGCKSNAHPEYCAKCKGDTDCIKPKKFYCDAPESNCTAQEKALGLHK